MYSLESEVDRLKRVRSRYRYRKFLDYAVYAVSTVGIIIFFDGINSIDLPFWPSGLNVILLIPLIFILDRLFDKLLDDYYNTIFNRRLSCPKCRKHIPHYEPWMCPICDEIHDIPALVKEYDEIKERNRALPKGAKKEELFRIVAYSFIYSCPNCAEVATTYKCHSCGEVLALTDDPDPEWFAYNPLLLPGGVFLEVEDDLKSKVDNIERKARSKYPEVNDARRKIYARRELISLLAEEEEYHKEEVDAGRMTETQAQSHLRIIRLWLGKRTTLN